MKMRFKSTLILLLSMVSGVAFGDSTLDDEIEIININFTNGWVKSSIDDPEIEMMWDVDRENNPNCKWYCDRDLGCAIFDSNRSGNKSATLYFNKGKSDDAFYYDTKLIIEHTGINMNNPSYVGLLKQTGYQYDYPVYELTGLNTELSKAGNGVWVTDEISLDDLKNVNLRLGIDPNHTSDFQGEWRIRNIRIVGKHRYGSGIEPTVITKISQLKDIASHTLIQLNTERMQTTYYGPTLYGVRDDTGSIILKTKGWKSEGNGYMGSPGEPFHGTIKGVYEFSNRTPSINWVTANVEVFDEGYGEPAYTPIDIEDYWDNIGNSVYVKCRNAILYNEYGFGGNTNLKEVNYGDIEVEFRAVAIPTDDGQIRFMFNDYQQPNMFLYDNEDYDFPDIANICQRIILNRSFVADKWHTFIFPIDFQFYDNSVEFAKFVSCTDGVLQFTTTDKYEAGVPYLIKFNSDKSQFELWTWYGTFSNPVNNDSNSDFNFVGSYSSMTPKEGSYYLSANNTIKPISKGGTIKSFRAYFEPNTPNGAMARAISIDGMVTAIEDIDFGDDTFDKQSQKIYNISGQHLGNDLNALPKGVYVVNGKKIIK